MSVSAPSPRSKILVVDDEEANLRLLERLLQTSGYERITCTTSSADAVEIVERDHSDLVLLDLHMPGLSGYDVLKRIRSLPETKHTPVLVLTADDLRAARLLEGSEGEPERQVLRRRGAQARQEAAPQHRCKRAQSGTIRVRG